MGSIPVRTGGGTGPGGSEKGVVRGTPALALALGTLVAAGIVLWATAPYPGVTVDSAEYLAVAQGVLSGEGFTMPYLGYDEPYRVLAPGERVAMTQFPPLYPSLLALTERLAPGDLLDAARWIGVVLMGISVAAGTFVIGRETKTAWPPLIGAGLLVAPDIVTLHAMAWSEPPMILALIGALYGTARYIRTGEDRYLAMAFGFGAVAALARFAGIAFIAGTAALVLVHGPGRPIERAARALIGALLAMVPVALWFGRNISIAGEASEKDFAWHPPGSKQILQAVEAIGAWVVPGRVLPLAGGALLIAVAAGWAVRRLRASDRTSSPMGPTSLWFFALYALFVVATRTVLDQNVSMDLRILSPLHVIAVIGICCSLPIRTRQDLRMPVAALLIALSVLTVCRGVFVAARFSGISVAAYTGDAWRTSDTMAAAARLDRAAPIATNAPDPLWLWQERLPMLVPPRSNRYSGAPNDAYLDQIQQLNERLGCDGVVVWFDQPTRKPPRIIDPVLAAGLDLERAQDLADGEIYEVRCSGES